MGEDADLEDYADRSEDLFSRLGCWEMTVSWQLWEGIELCLNDETVMMCFLKFIGVLMNF